MSMNYLRVHPLRTSPCEEEALGNPNGDTWGMGRGSLKKVEDAPSRVERQIYDFGAQMKAGSVAEMEKADKFKTDEFVINDYKNLTVKCAQD